MPTQIKNAKMEHQRQSAEKVYGLAHGGQVPHAIVLWNKHKERHEGCVCENRLFDQKLCGFCLLSGLQTESLAQPCRSGAERYILAAETVSRYLMRSNRTIAGLAAE